MVLLAMLVLLGIGGSMICLFKDEFLDGTAATHSLRTDTRKCMPGSRRC